jgi:gas vesicle protein
MRNHRNGTITAAAVGALCGAGIALLLAPQSGKKTRKDIRRISRKVRMELTDSFENLSDEVWERLQKEYDRGCGWTEHTITDIHKAIGSGKDYIRKELDKVWRH